MLTLFVPNEPTSESIRTNAVASVGWGCIKARAKTARADKREDHRRNGSFGAACRYISRVSFCPDEACNRD
jgi:hypothetical protein